jgi:hypothetical protein
LADNQIPPRTTATKLIHMMAKKMAKKMAKESKS